MRPVCRSFPSPTGRTSFPVRSFFRPAAYAVAAFRRFLDRKAQAARSDGHPSKPSDFQFRTMKKLLLTILLPLSLCTGLRAQPLPAHPESAPEADRRPAVRRTELNELSVTAGASIPSGYSSFHFTTFSLQYAHTGLSGWGCRGGVTWLGDRNRIDRYFAIPLRASYLLGHERGGAKAGVTAGFEGGCRNDSFFSLADFLVALIPKRWEFNAGFTPGYIFRRQGRDRLSDDPIADRRFACTFDLGTRATIPVRRFGIVLGFTYSAYLTDNFVRPGDRFRLPRSFVSLEAGLSLSL